jgi:hypothetical protein
MKGNTMRHVAPIKIGLMALLFTAAAFAQRDLGTIVGTVTDQQGAAVPNAKVTVIEDATGLKYQLETSATGEFVRPALKPSTYSVEVEAAGFKKAVQHNILLTAGDRTGVTIALTVGEVNQSIEVSAAAPLLQTESTILGADVDAKQLSELPLGGQRDFAFLARLSPGVVPAEPGARDAQGGGFSANGVRSNGQNNFLLNGVDNNVNVIDFLNQTSYVIGPSMDAIGEMRVMTNGYNAEYGRGAGGVVNVTLKSGTNEIHGAIFEYLQNRDLNANRWENNANGNPRGAYGQNQFGAAVGGPAIKNRTFWFADYQGTRLTSTGGAVANLGTSGYFTIPTPEMKTGDFSRLLTGGTNGVIYDPTSTRTVNGVETRTPFPGNKIPASQIDPAAAKIMALFPSPNAPYPATGIPQNDYFTTTSGTLQNNQWDIRADHRISDKDSIFGSISWSTTDKFNAQPLPGALDATYFNSNAEEDLARNAMISYTRVWNPTIISETRVAFTRLVTSRVQANPNTDQYTAFGIGGFDPTTALNGGLPSVNMNRYSGWGASDWLPSKEYNNVMDFIQNLSVTKGTHSYKFGAEFREIKFPFFQVPSPHGDMTFDRRNTANQAVDPTGSTTGDEYASFLSGQVYSGQLSTTNFVSSQKSAWAFFAQDDWKISRKLTINYGVRYELFSPIGERFGRQSNFDFQNLTLYIPKGPNQDAALPPNFASAFPEVKVSRGQVENTLIPWDKTDIAPRIGIAYNLLPKTVFRIGYGIFYGGEENQGGNPNRGESVPFNETVNLASPAGVSAFDPSPYFSAGFHNGFPTNVFTLPAPISFRGISPDFLNSLVHKWNVALQHEFKGGNALELSYVGNHQAHSLLQPDFNACPNSPISGISCNTLRPYPDIGGISGTASNGFGNYEGMTAKLEKRFSAGWQYMFAYTYGHALANSGTTLSGSNGFTYLDNTNLSTSYSSAAWDIRHSVVANFLYEFPFGKGKKYLSGNALANAIVGGWQANAIFTFRTGSPFTIRGNNCVGLWNGCMGQLTTGKQPNAAPSNGRNANEWFDVTAFGSFNAAGVFVPNTPTPGTYGNNGLQTNYAPGQRNVDLSLFKAINFTERFKGQFRAEAFNLANTPQWGTPDNNVYDSNFGRITSTQTGSERRIQLALRIMF